MPSRKRQPVIALLIETSRSSSRDVCRGIGEYARIHGPWTFFLKGRDLHGELEEWLPKWRGDGIIWFEFEELCEKPRGAVDFIEIARAFNTVVLSNMPQLGEDDASAARRFVVLVDEFYDRNVKLLISAAVPIGDLYTGRKLSFEFQRTASRLMEMQSHDYLARPHLA